MYRLPVWILLWLFISSLVVFWDVSFVLLRPRSMKGGDLFWLYTPYELYIEVDRAYGDLKNTFVISQSYLNILENILNFIAIFTHFLHSPSSPLFALTGLSMTLGKTILYTLMDVVCGFCHTKENSINNLILFYIIPNGMWLLMPFLSIVSIFLNFFKPTPKTTKNKKKD
eukprot:TRINITY_DN2173_c0_g1_i1.p1 TRINITY_DN2173_c0_g1~~TRINITY_DN2173_c0_g1_i1.p1  ORF type:complete len:170 (-),score=16.99 TRINITY_DN2173_c0_g1_i1:156-665(-)